MFPLRHALAHALLEGEGKGAVAMIAALGSHHPRMILPQIILYIAIELYGMIPAVSGDDIPDVLLMSWG